MEKLMVYWLLFAGLSVALAADIQTYFMEGGKLTLDLRPSGPITYILWKFDGNLLGEWVKDKVDLTFYSTFRGRTTLDTNTGRLEISSMTKADVGVYSVEINNKLQPDQYKAMLIKAVPKPEVWIAPIACASSESCTATCDGDTTGADPVTYSWRMGDGEWKQLKKTIDITRADTADVKTFTCRVKNPLSNEESERKDNPLFGAGESGGLGADGVAGIVIGLIGFAAAVGLGVAWGKKIGPFKNRGSTSPDASAENGNVTPLKIKDTSGEATAAEERLPLKENPSEATAAEERLPLKENPGEDTAAEESQPLKENPGEDTAAEERQPLKENPSEATAAEERLPLKENPGEDTAAEESQPIKENPGEATAAETAHLNSSAAPATGEE